MPKARTSILTKTPESKHHLMKIPLIVTLCLLLPLPTTAAAAKTPPAAESPVAETAVPPPLTIPPQRAETRRGKALAEQLATIDKETEVLWLGTGDDEHLGLYRADHSGRNFASVLILHDNLQHADWPGLVRTLRRQLPAHGWNTLAIGLPDYRVIPDLPPRPQPDEPAQPDPTTSAKPETKPAAKPAAPAKPPAAASPAAAADEPAAASHDLALKDVEYTAEQVPDIIDSRVRGAIAQLKQKSPQPVVLVAIGLSAGITAKQAQTMLIKDIAGLVIIDPVQPVGSTFNTDLDAMDLRIPILDIAPEFAPRTDPALRLHGARRMQHQLYQQRIIRGAQPGFRGHETSVLKAVRGWGERWFKS